MHQVNERAHLSQFMQPSIVCTSYTPMSQPPPMMTNTAEGSSLLSSIDVLLTVQVL
jgi:hypothetical protein